MHEERKRENEKDLKRICEKATDQSWNKKRKKKRGCPRGVMVTAMDCGISSRVITFTFGHIPLGKV